MVLGNSGTYTLAIRGQSGNSPVNYTFSVVNPDIVSSELTFDTAVAGQITQKGERDIYTFTGDKGQKLFLDTLVDDTNIKATLIDPQGNKILNEISLAADDARHPLILPLAGDYRLTIDGSGETTADYNFQLHDLNSADELDIASPITGSLDPGSEIEVYKLTGYEGQRLYFQGSQSNDSTPNWLLYSPGNNELVDKALNEDFEVVFSSDEAYYLIIRGDGNLIDTFDYEFEVTTTTANPVAQPLALNTLHSNNIAQVGQQNVYTFEGTVGQQIYLDANSSEEFVAKIYAPNGKEVFDGNLASDSSNLILTEAGTYQVIIDGVAAATGDYDFRLANIADADVLPTDSAVTGTIAAGETDLYRFDGKAGQRLLFDRTTGSSSNRWGLYNSNGELVTAWNRLSNDFEYTLTATDEYILRLSGNGNNDSAYSFQIISSEWQTVPLTLGETVTTDLSKGGERDTYTFEGTLGQRLYFDSISGNSSVTAKLYSPTNKLVFDGRTDLDSSLFTLTENGSYRLVIDGNNTATSNYSFNLQDLAAVDSLELAITITDSLDNGKKVKLYQFRGTKGAVLNFNLDAESWSGASWRLYDPGNRIISNPSTSTPDFQTTLAANGTYTLAIIGGSTETVDYSFEVTDNTPATVFNTGLNNNISGTLAAGEVIDSSFTASAGTQVFLDSLGSNTWQVRVRLIAPDGSFVFNNHDSNSDTGIVVLPQSGEYTLQTYGYYSSSTGNYNYQLLELPGSLRTPGVNYLEIGGIVSGTLEGKQAKVYSFEGVPGLKVMFNGISGYNSQATLYKPNGDVVFGVSNFNSYDSGLVSLAENGLYHLVVRGW